MGNFIPATGSWSRIAFFLLCSEQKTSEISFEQVRLQDHEDCKVDIKSMLEEVIKKMTMQKNEFLFRLKHYILGDMREKAFFERDSKLDIKLSELERKFSANQIDYSVWYYFCRRNHKWHAVCGYLETVVCRGNTEHQLGAFKLLSQKRDIE